METIKQAKNRLETTTDGKNGFFRGVLWANEFIDVNNELPESEGQLTRLSKVVIARCEDLSEEVSACYDTITDEWKTYPDWHIIKVAEWRPIERT